MAIRRALYVMHLYTVRTSGPQHCGIRVRSEYSYVTEPSLSITPVHNSHLHLNSHSLWLYSSAMLSYFARASCSRPALRSFARQPLLAHRLSLVLPAPTSIRSLRTSSVLRNVPAHPLDATDDRPRLTSQVIPPASAPAAVSTSLIERWTPAWASGAKPYLHLMRLDKPAGTLLLYWPCGESRNLTIHTHPASFRATLGVV